MIDFVSPKLVVIDYYDSLINQIDIYTEELIEKCQDNNHHLFSEINNNSVAAQISQKSADQNGAELEMFDFSIDPYLDDYELANNDDNSTNTATTKFVSGVTRVKDYLNSLRMNAIEEIRKAQEENIRHYELIRDKVRWTNDDTTNSEDLVRSLVFSNRFCFLIRIVVENSSSSSARSYYPPRCGAHSSICKLFTIVVDFYMNDAEIDLLKRFCEFSPHRIIKKEADLNPKIVLNEKTLLIHLMSKYLRARIQTTWSNQIIRIDKSVLLSVEKINLQHTNIKISQVNLSDECNEFSSLKSFNLDPGHRMLENVNLNGLKNLEYLYLMHTELIGSFFSSLPKLRKLILYECALSKLDRTFLIDLPNLQVLEIFLPTIDHEFDFVFDSSSRLKWLNLRKIVMPTHLIESLFKTVSDELTILNLSNNAITNEMAQLLFENLNTRKLLKLNLGRNNLSSLNGEWFKEFNELEELVLESNQISEINLNQLDCLPNLEVLDLHGNSLEVLQVATFKPLKKLKVLYLGDNPIKHFDEDVFQGLVGLEKLYLVSLRNVDFNRITDYFFKGLSTLSLLKLNFNYLSSIDANGFCCLENLRELDLSRNRIKLEFSTFSALCNLKCLDLSRNGLEVLDENVFTSLKSLERLNLAYNHLKTLNPVSFNGLINLKDLDLSFNTLTSFSIDILEKMPSLKKVNFKYISLSNYQDISKVMNQRNIEVII